MNSSPNSPNELVKECIFQALIILMETKSFHHISVSEITRKAGVSRMAYYRNYNSKESIISEYLDRLFGIYLEDVKDLTEMDTYLFAKQFFSYFKKEHVLIDSLIRSKISFLLLDRFDTYIQVIFNKVVQDEDLSKKQSRYMQYFFTGGLFKLLIEWVSSGMAESEEEMAQLILDFKRHP
ncbi:TetR/AcrR family transcriptional regulator [Cohnella abietis]|uniref:TetR family transcriptional regulator n=1 Tax=Cohnella abietis TaxID=2507935 RepID=A0A3T1CYU8_9BACL|nr:TetR/AcrR family transcriptional regulator [Cohnella abietis]BBI30925.1 TetR family transcriptional regulator [Cohnella abietis]